MNDRKKIYVVIPAYQAALTIKSVFDRLPPALAEKDIAYLVVNDGSADATECGNTVVGGILRQICGELRGGSQPEESENQEPGQQEPVGTSLRKLRGWLIGRR